MVVLVVEVSQMNAWLIALLNILTLVLDKLVSADLSRICKILSKGNLENKLRI